MKYYLSLFLAVAVLTGCSAARPVIRTEESFAVQTQASDQADDLTEEKDSGGGMWMVTSGTKALQTKTPKTKSDKIISASDKGVTSGIESEPGTTAGGTRPERVTSAQTKPASKPVSASNAPSTQTRPASSTMAPETTSAEPTTAAEPSTSEETQALPQTAPDPSGGQPPETTTTSLPPEGTGPVTTPAEPDKHDPLTADKTSEYDLSDYYPISANRRINYTSADSDEISLLLQYFHKEEARVVAQFKQMNGSGSTHINVVQITPDKISDLYYSGEIPYRSNLIGWNDYEERIILRSPLKLGSKWKSTGLAFEITAVDEMRRVGGSDIPVLDVTVAGDEETIRFSYGVGIGLVSSDVVNKDGSLSNIQRFENLEEDARDSYEVAFYFPSDDKNSQTVTKRLEFETNDPVKVHLAKAYKSLAEEYGLVPVLGEEVEIQYIFREGDIVLLDLNEAFISFVNEAPELENARIQNLVNTVTKYYQGSEGVLLTISDQRYESENRKIEPDEVLRPDY